MNTINYNELEQLSQSNPNLDSLGFYFLGMCFKHVSCSLSLNTIFRNLPFKLTNLREILKADHCEKGFLTRTMTQLIDNITLNEKFLVFSRSEIEKSGQNLTKTEEEVKYWFQDFNLLQTLYPKITKN